MVIGDIIENGYVLPKVGELDRHRRGDMVRMLMDESSCM